MSSRQPSRMASSASLVVFMRKPGMPRNTGTSSVGLPTHVRIKETKRRFAAAYAAACAPVFVLSYSLWKRSTTTGTPAGALPVMWLSK